MATPCDCPECVNGSPDTWVVTLGGTPTNNACGSCGSLPASYTVAHSGSACIWQSTFPTVCGFNLANLGVGRDVNGVLTLTFTLTADPPIFNPPTWKAAVPDCGGGRTGQFTLAYNAGPFPNTQCNWPATVIARPASPAISHQAVSDHACLPPLAPGCPPGTSRRPFDPPPLGAPTGCCAECGGDCAAGGCTCGASTPPRRYVIRDGCEERLQASCPPGSVPQYGGAAMRRAALMFGRWRDAVRPPSSTPAARGGSTSATATWC